LLLAIELVYLFCKVDHHVFELNDLRLVKPLDSGFSFLIVLELEVDLALDFCDVFIHEVVSCRFIKVLFVDTQFFFVNSYFSE
jgi:hypothetical protein